MLLGVEGDHAYRQARGAKARRLQARHQVGHQGFGFDLVDARAAFFVAPGHPVKADGVVFGGGGRKRHQPAAVVLVVAEGDQALVARAVVPRQVARRQAGAQAFVQDAFQVAFNFGHVVVRAVFAAKEVGGWQLFGVAHHHHLLGAGHGADGVPDRNLRGFVKDDDVEIAGAGRQVLRYRQRAHQQAGRQLQHHCGDFLQQLAQRQVLAFFGDFAAQHAPLAVAIDAVECRQLRAQLGANPLARGGGEFVVQRAKGLDALLVLGGDKALEHFVLIDHFAQPPAGVIDLKRLLRLRRRNAAQGDGIGQRAQAGAVGAGLGVAPSAPGVQAGGGGFNAAGNVGQLGQVAVGKAAL